MTALESSVGSIVGFNPKRPSIVTRAGLTVDYQLRYDISGRAQTERGTLTDGGKTFEISFSQISYNIWGDATGYRADIRQKP